MEYPPAPALPLAFADTPRGSVPAPVPGEQLLYMVDNTVDGCWKG